MRKKENLIQENLICTNHPSYCHTVGKSSMIISTFKKSPPYSIYALTCACIFTSTKYNIKKKNLLKNILVTQMASSFLVFLKLKMLTDGLLGCSTWEKIPMRTETIRDLFSSWHILAWPV